MTVTGAVLAKYHGNFQALKFIMILPAASCLIIPNGAYIPKQLATFCIYIAAVAQPSVGPPDMYACITQHD